MAIIRIGNSVIDTKGERERLNALELQYDGRIPDEAIKVAKYGSYQAAALVDADAAVKSALEQVNAAKARVASWEKADPKRYAPETIRECIARNSRDVTSMLAYHEACLAHRVACESAYQAMLAGVDATR